MAHKNYSGNSFGNEKVYDYLIVGSGIIGLTTAYSILEKYPQSSIAVLEAKGEIAPPESQSASNSNVVHAGVYYKPGSLKARFCKEGREWIEDFCKANNLPFEQCGKMIVATNDEEVERLEELHRRASLNDLTLEVLNEREIRSREPNITGKKALFVHESSITDFKMICSTIANIIEDKGADIYLNSRVESFSEDSEIVTVGTNRSGTGKERLFKAKKVILSGGVQSDRLGKAAGFDIDFRIIPFRGEYYILPEYMGDITRSLIYPVPDPSMPFLGVHLTKTVHGEQTVGPNAVVGFDRENKRKLSISIRDALDIANFPGSWKLASKFLKTAILEQRDSLFKKFYIGRVKKYSPSVEIHHLKEYPCGIRAQAVKADGSMIEDFDIRTSESGSIVLCVNVPSPAATSAYPISQHIAELL